MLRFTIPTILSHLPSKTPPFLNPISSLSFSQRCTQSVCEYSSTKLTPVTSAYIHLPFCRKRCHYCDFPIIALGSSSSHSLFLSSPNYDNDPRISNYISLLLREIESTKLESGNNSHLETVFFGGGTPSLVPPTLIATVLSALNAKFGISAQPEISIEMDPGTFDKVRLREILELGVNRVSLGVQAFQEKLLSECGRAHRLEEVYEAIEILSGCDGLENWSLDLISSLPHQTEEMWEQSLNCAVQAGPTHISVYDLQVEQGTKFGNLYAPGEFPLPTESQSASFYKIASKILSQASYNHYEISSYCKDGFECKHNLTYWQNKSFYGFGLGSASYTNGIRFSRPKRLKEYTNYVNNLEQGIVSYDNADSLEMKDLAMDVVMLSLRTARGLDLQSFSKSFGKCLVLSVCKALVPFMEKGLVVPLDERRKVLPLSVFESELRDDGELGKEVVFVRLSDPDGFLLSNEIISTVFGVISP